MEHTQQEIKDAVNEIRAELIRDIGKGVVPQTVPDFGTLHDYVDANTYGGFTDPARRADWSTADLNTVQTAVDAWLRAGQPVAVPTSAERVEALPEGAVKQQARAVGILAERGQSRREYAAGTITAAEYEQAYARQRAEWRAIFDATATLPIAGRQGRY